MGEGKDMVDGYGKSDMARVTGAIKVGITACFTILSLGMDRT
jgi:hypothetical protein